MRKSEKEILENISTNIKYYASMENAKFSMDKEKDAEIKNAVRLYMDTWVEMQAYLIDDLLELADEKSDYRLKELERDSYDFQVHMWHAKKLQKPLDK